MRAFAVGLAVMVVLSVASGFALGSLGQPSVDQSLALKSVTLSGK